MACEHEHHWPTADVVLLYWTEGRSWDDALRACRADVLRVVCPGWVDTLVDRPTVSFPEAERRLMLEGT
jgi:hypothetical protein